VPVLGNGRWISAPVYIGDVSGAIVSCLDEDSTIGRSYDIGGPDQISFDELIDRISAALGLRRRKLHVPFPVALTAAGVLARLLPRPPVTVSNVLGSNQDTHIDITPARRDFGFDPLQLDVGIKRALAMDARPELTRNSASSQTCSV
jgi:NADH dehydrogenase